MQRNTRDDFAANAHRRRGLGRRQWPMMPAGRRAQACGDTTGNADSTSTRAAVSQTAMPRLRSHQPHRAYLAQPEQPEQPEQQTMRIVRSHWPHWAWQAQPGQQTMPRLRSHWPHRAYLAQPEQQTMRIVRIPCKWGSASGQGYRADASST